MYAVLCVPRASVFGYNKAHSIPENDRCHFPPTLRGGTGLARRRRQSAKCVRLKNHSIELGNYGLEKDAHGMPARRESI